MKLNYETGEGEEGDAPLSPTGNAILCRCASPTAMLLNKSPPLKDRAIRLHYVMHRSVNFLTLPREARDLSLHHG